MRDSLLTTAQPVARHAAPRHPSFTAVVLTGLGAAAMVILLSMAMLAGAVLQ